MQSETSLIMLTNEQLFEKFNAAFYDAQTTSSLMQNKTYDVADELLETFDETFFTNIDAYEDSDETGDYFADFFISKCSSDAETDTFDYTELSRSLMGDDISATLTNNSWETDFDRSLDNSLFFPDVPERSSQNEDDAYSKTNGTDLTNFLRNVPADSLDVFAQVNSFYYAASYLNE